MVTIAKLLRVASILLCLFGHSAVGEEPKDEIKTQANVVAEVTFQAARPHDDPFNTVTLDAIFTDPAGKTLRVPAFWDGGNVWKVRYASSAVGLHPFTTECSDPNDAGLQHVAGTVRVEPYTGDNPLYQHGAPRVADDHRHLAYADGTPFLWLGDTWWMALSNRLKWPEEFATLAADRKAKGFNVIQIIAGLYPDQPAFDPRSENEAGFVWEKDYSHLRPEYFDAADRRIQYLVDQGFVPCIVGAWGFHLEWMGEEKMKQHLRYVAARWGAYPVVFCAVGEVNMSFYLATAWPKGDDKQVADWEPVIAYLRTVNAFGRLITAHPTNIAAHSARALFKTPGLLDFDMLQTGHGKVETLRPTIAFLRSACAAQPPMPVINAEVDYEALYGIPAAMPRLMTWAGLLSGEAGQTYGANGIWQMDRADMPYGGSPRRDNKIENFGSLTWDKAMQLPGSQQVGFAKKLLEQLGFENFAPHQDWARWTEPTKDPFLVPYSAGVPRQVRVTYVPTPQAITLTGLEPDVTYRASRFDPVTGEQSEIDLARTNQQDMAISAPAGCDHDWVVILDSRPAKAAAR